MDDSRTDQALETQGITVQRDARGMTQLRRLQGVVVTGEDAVTTPVMILRSERNHRRFELLHRGKLVLAIEPDGATRFLGGSAEVYEALKDWVEMSVGK